MQIDCFLGSRKCHRCIGTKSRDLTVDWECGYIYPVVDPLRDMAKFYLRTFRKPKLLVVHVMGKGIGKIYFINV